MNEQEWLACTDPDALAIFLHYRCKDTDVGRRKLGLLACACLRRIAHLLTDERSRHAIEVTEQDVEKKIPTSELSYPEFLESEFAHAHREALDGWGQMAEAAHEGGYGSPLLRAMPDAGLAAYQAIDGDLQCLMNASNAAANYAAAPDTPEWKLAKAHEQKGQLQLIRCIFGNPFQSTTFDSRWLTPAVRNLARQIYEGRDFDHLPLLAEALAENGCRNAEMLRHCASGGQHVRGCWVVDLVLECPK